MIIFKRLLAILVPVAAFPYLLSPVYRFPPPRSFAGPAILNPYAHLHGTWQLANLHAHGRAWNGLTNGRQSDDDVVRAYKDRGYTVAGISDYQHIAAHEGVATIPIYEHGYNFGKHHQLAIGAHRIEWLDFPLWQGLSQKQYILNRVGGTSDLIAIAHPMTAYSEEDLQALTGYQLLEVVNGPFVADDLWDAALSSGHPVWAIANDDSHDVSDARRMGVAWNMIDAPSGRTADIVAALRAGRSYAVSGTAGQPDHGEAVVSSVEMRGTTLSVSCFGAPASFSFIGQNGDLLDAEDDVTSASYTLRPEDTYVRPVVRTPNTTMYLNPVIKYDGVHVGPPVATTQLVATWVERTLIAIACAAVVVALWRRGGGNGGRGGNGFTRSNGATEDERRRDHDHSFSASVFAILSASASALALLPSLAAAQTTGPSPLPPAPVRLGSTVDPAALADLPTSENIFSVLETTQAELTSDRFFSGGLSLGRFPRLGAFLNSWTQTSFRVGDVDITDPDGSGSPMLFPPAAFWERVEVTTAGVDADSSAPGLTISLEPRRPTAKWTRTVDASLSRSDLVADVAAGTPPAVARLTRWNNGSVLVGGPLVPDRIGLVLGAGWTGQSETARGSTTDSEATVGSIFTNLLFTPREGEEIRSIAWLQRVRTTERDISAHVQETWARRTTNGSAWRVSGAYTQRHRTPVRAISTGLVVDRTVDGPVPDLVETGEAVDRRWSAVGRATSAPHALWGRSHAVRAGIDVGAARQQRAAPFSGAIGELVDGQEARVWNYSNPGLNEIRHETTVSVFAADRVDVLPRVVLDAAIRYDGVSGAASGALRGIRWQTWLPRLAVRWAVADVAHVTLFASYARTADQLMLDTLAVGDPAAPVATVARWNGPEIEQLVARVGPGTGGDPTFTAIDASLARPVTDEVIVGIESRPVPPLRLRFSGIAKREQHLLGVVDVGVPSSGYAGIGVRDPGLDLAHAGDDQILIVYDRLPGSFGRDRYVLTNPAEDAATLVGLVFSADASTERFFLLFGATASQTDGPAGNRGFRANENDLGVLGEVFVDPNATTFARGRLFADRAYTMKLTAIYRFPRAIHVGVIARYQDGQPFARLVIVPNLNQGAEAVRAFPNGDSRFTFTGTLDVRLTKGFTIGGRQLDAIVDAYNIINLGNEVEERVVTGPGFRMVSAIQPPRAVHLGLRLRF